MTAEKLKTFLDHGVELDYKDGSKEAPGNCPFCDKEGKFSVKVETGEWKCWSCRAGSDKGGGNVYTFLRLMYDLYQSPGKEMAALAASRKLLRPQTLDAWGVRKSTTTGDWIVPAFSPNNGKLHNLYRYVKGAGGKYRLWATSGATHGLFGWQFYDAKKPDVYLCEGPWDAMALLEVMRLSKRTQDGNLEETGAESISLYGRSNVLATPGSNVFADAWSNSFAGKRVYLLYDNDHPRMNPKTNKEITPAGLDGMKRVAAMLAKAEEPPLEIHYLQWGENGCDLSLASGYDVRDHLCVGQRAKDRIGQLALLLSKLKPVPPEWIPGRSPNAEPGGVLVDCLPCAEWKVLQTAWKKALKWTPGLDRALACMLASITSVRMPGDQLWLKIVGPPSCLHGDTPIYDPTDGTTLSVRDRYKIGSKFFVYTRHQDGNIGTAQALPPARHGPAPMYKVTFESGRTIKVTSGHQVWDGSSYVEIHTIADGLHAFGPHPLPTISDTELLARTPDVLRSSRKAEDFQSDCPVDSCSCDEQLHGRQGSGRGVVPSQAYAREYGNSPLPSGDDRVDNTRTRNRPHSNVSHQPSLGECCHVSPPQVECEYERPAAEGGGEHDPYSCQGNGKPLKDSVQTHKDQRPSVLAHESRSNQSEHQPHGQTATRLLSKGEIFCNTEEWNDNHGSNQRPHASMSPGEAACWQGASRHQTPVSIVGPYQIRPTSSDKPLQGFDLTGTTQRLDDDEPQTKGQPLHFSITLGDILVDQPTLTTTDSVVKVELVGEEEYYDFHVPETNNYWAVGLFHHNCGKSTLCEAVSVNKRFVYPKSSIRGFHSGYKTDKEGDEDNSLIPNIKNKTLVTKDGDTLLQSPNLSQILGEARDLYDTTSRTHYRNKTSRDYEDIRMTWLLCGTESLRQLDSSELGERFLDCVMMDQIDDELEDEIGWKAIQKIKATKGYEADDPALKTADNAETMAKQLTGGYINYLRDNAATLLGEVDLTDDASHAIMDLGLFIAYMRSRPSKKQNEGVTREMATRLRIQLTKLACCLAVVMNRKSVDEQVLKYVTDVAMDTSRGRTMDIVRHLYEEGDKGLEMKALAIRTNHTDDDERTLLQFLRRIKVVELFRVKLPTGYASTPKWRLTEKARDLYQKIVHPDKADPSDVEVIPLAEEDDFDPTVETD